MERKGVAIGREDKDPIGDENFVYIDCIMAIFQLVMFYYSFPICYKWERWLGGATPRPHA